MKPQAELAQNDMTPTSSSQPAFVLPLVSAGMKTSLAMLQGLSRGESLSLGVEESVDPLLSTPLISCHERTPRHLFLGHL